MTNQQWNAFTSFREQFKNKCYLWSKLSNQLKQLQIMAASVDTPAYQLDNSVVYNYALDSICKEDDINLIVLGDNPGKEEQLNSNQKYLVGQSGRIAEGFFRRNDELKTDFRRNVIILNKTPIHTAKTKHLKYLIKNGSKSIVKLIYDSQIWMAEQTAILHKKLVAGCTDNSFVPEVWLVGYSELKNNGIFLPFKDMLKKSYDDNIDCWNKVRVYQHFSMNRFLVDINKYKQNYKSLSLYELLEKIGEQHRDEIFENE